MIIEDSRIAKILKVTLASQAKHKDHKITHRAFTFTRFDGRKIGNIVLAWLSQFDDYFFDESFSESLTKSSVQQTTCLVRILFGGM